jgi:hypothetical protein
MPLDATMGCGYVITVQSGGNRSQRPPFCPFGSYALRHSLEANPLMAKASKQGWALVALDCAVDTTTPA